MNKIFAHKSIFTIEDEYGEKSSITLDKYIADVLTKHLNVHEYLNNQYDSAVQYNVKNGLKLSRIKVGDLVRQQAASKASRLDLILF
jgi:hypothetical protein